MDKRQANRFAVVSPDLVTPRLADMEQDFIRAWIRMKGNLKLGGGVQELGYRQEKKAKDLAADAHSRRLRQAGMSGLSKEAKAQVTALARAGATFNGPACEDAVYQFAADLHAESPWMRDVSAWVMNQMLAHVENGGSGLALPPVILAGPPGIGKSHFARRLAELAGTPSRLIDVGGGSAGFRITGTEKGWSTAQAGIPVETILSSHAANPVMVVDEVDKAGEMRSESGRSTSLTTALLPLLEAGTAQQFECPFHRLPFDMSRVVWIMTANDAVLIPAPLRDRARVFHLQDLNAEDAVDHFDRLTSHCCDQGELDQCRAFIARMTEAPRGISLRQIRQLVEALQVSSVPFGH
ncbi:Lon protease 2 [Sulfitobacter indolifex]|uniref:Lon protease, putative n=1 Tax=Sulfitobacter indolifex HEL-45 TaxID=391624 RepID=A0ABM9X8E3_9RHOB|nr:AAA family ATPase [Sulfitobacter indolifex]EDQ05786.1 Lon protease, putative [Sulfitobacter indolifex HEL-45]UOA19956.1 Lon protease 2 [Sulfitobacter indolifex]